MKLQAAVLDWAGTMVDFGSCAPVEAMREVFNANAMEVDDSLIRRFMGRAKRDHVTAILSDPEAASTWTAAHGAPWTEADIDALMSALEPAMQRAAGACAELIPGAAQAVRTLKAHGLKIGSTTGYTRSMMSAILPRAAAQGYEPETVVCAGETLEGRPAPLMIWKCLVHLGVWPAAAALVVDDALVGIEAGRHAGCWTVGLTASGNGVGLSHKTFMELSPAAAKSIQEPVARAFEEVGADFVIATIAELPSVVEEADRRLALGQRPGSKGRTGR